MRTQCKRITHVKQLFWTMAAEHQSKMQTKRDLDERVIEAVQQFPCLYDPTSKQYRDGGHTTAVWAEVAAIVGRDPVFCKERWRKVRDAYVKVKKGCTAKNTTTSWPHYESMDFLCEHIKHRSSKSRELDDSVASISDVRSNDGVEKVQIEYQLDDGNFQVLSEDHTGSQTTPRRLILHSDAGGSPKIKRLCRRAEPSEIGFLSQVSTDISGLDEESLFGRMVAATLRRFPPRAKAMCKFKIQEAIFQVENEAWKTKSELKVQEEQS